MSLCNTQKRESLQVIKVSQVPERRYELDEKALASILLRPEVQCLPVVVVSIAGSFRGGKSFMLNFFLRYLNASRQSQSSNEWLGKEDVVLEGFEWRGGCDANTKGIHMWSEPIIVNFKGSNEKVAVLLMDTQGTFDTESDMGENLTIFALSTLLSSVQIYNLRGNIAENDLQNLQLFTEYGKLVTNGAGKAFQTLLFLIRDWEYASQHPYGYAGGEQLMKTRITPELSRNDQLRKVRDHIHSCYEKLQCFLMPHPGLVDSETEFKGRLCEIRPKFKESLLELVPSLFDPNNLNPKTINGEKIQAQTLFEFFKQYVGIFNSDDLPKATTIFQATTEACMTSVLREAHECYENKMKINIKEDKSALTEMVQKWHTTAVKSTLDYFQKKKKLGSKRYVKGRLADLKKELEARLALYLWQNDVKVREGVSVAKAVYENTVINVSKELSRICLHAKDLHELHSNALAAAVNTFAGTRPGVSSELDVERKGLIESLGKQYNHLCAVNQQNHCTAKLKARELYLSRMKDGVNQKNISFEVFRLQHEDAKETAIKYFQSFRNQLSSQTEDPEVDQLQQDINNYFKDFENKNAYNNLRAMQAAQLVYNDNVWSAWGPHSCCFHPRALQETHDEAKDSAVKQFLKDRAIQSRYEEIKLINSFNNDQLVDHAFGEYRRRLDKYSQPGLSSILIAPFIFKVFKWLPEYHAEAEEAALSAFHDRRRGQLYPEEDDYLTNLKKRISEACAVYTSPLQAIIRELGLQHMFGIDTDEI